MPKAMPPLVEVADLLDQAIAAREALRIDLQVNTRVAGVSQSITRFAGLPGVTRRDVEDCASGVRLRTWDCAHLAGWCYRSAGDLLGAMRWSEAHPGRVPPGTMDPADLDLGTPPPPPRQPRLEEGPRHG